MRRVIALLLLTLLTLQSTWAVAAAYCQHEGRRDAAHFGHHADAQAAAANPADDGDDGDGSAAEGHCHSCHAACIYLLQPIAPARWDSHGAAPPHGPVPRLPLPPASPLERPDWQALA